MSRSLDNYIEVGPRKAVFRKDHPKGSIETNFTTVEEGDRVALVIQATVKDGEGRILGSAQSMLQDLGEEKGLEKIESTAVGRALDHAGYPSDVRYTDGVEAEQEAPKPTTKTSNSLAAKAAASAVTKTASAPKTVNPLAAKAAGATAKPATKTTAPATRRLGGLSKPAPVQVETQTDEGYEANTDYASEDSESFDATEQEV